MKVPLELNFAGKTMYLNFWDSMHGDDVVCQVKGDKLLLSQYDDEGNELLSKEITFAQFVRMVKKRAKTWV